jgi:hypothetical protein
LWSGSVTFTGDPVEIRYQAALLDTAGNAAHAATFIRERLIVLDRELRADPREHGRILTHELFHFAWVRLGNPRRLEWEELLRAEWRARARGETGWSAEWRKDALTAAAVTGRTREWREYSCESFCDTAAWIFAGARSELTLGLGWRAARRRWYSRHIAGRDLPI